MRTQPLAKLGTPQDVEDCLPCRIVGSVALGSVGFYALNQSRVHQPGSVIGKRIMAGVGICVYRPVTCLVLRLSVH